MTTVENAATFAGASPTDELFIALFSAVQVLISERVGAPNQSRCPTEVRDLAILLASRRAWEIYKSQNGYTQYGPDGQLSFIPADVLKPAEAMLKPYKKLGALG